MATIENWIQTLSSEEYLDLIIYFNFDLSRIEDLAEEMINLSK